MDIDEVIETSDIEELEELQNLDSLGQLGLLPHALERQRIARAWERIAYSPPRKRLKTFHDTTDSPPSESLARLSVSPTKSISANRTSPLRSRSSSTMHDTDSPSWLSASSQTSVHDFHNPVKEEQENPLENSQDPLILKSPMQEPLELHRTPPRTPLGVLSVSANQSHTPNPFLMTPSLLHSQTTATSNPRRSLSPRHSLPSTTPAHHTPSLFSSQPLFDRMTVPRDNDLEDDELLVFTPNKPTSSPARIPSLEPLTPLSIRDDSPTASIRESISTPRSVFGSSSPSPPPAVLIAPQQEPTIDMANMLEYEPQESRYSLRKRNVAQLNPYTVDDIRYKRALRSNPEAIVKLKAIERHLNNRHSGNHYEHEGETQQDIYMDDGDVDEDASWEEKERRRLELHAEKQRRRAERERLRLASEQDKAKYPDILQDLSNSEGEEMDSIAKEARKAQRQLEKEKRAREKEERRKQREEHARKAKRFPVHHSASSARPHSAAKKSGDESEMDDGGRSRTAEKSSRPASSPNNEAQAIQNYFDEDGGFDSEPDNHPASSIVNGTGRSSRSPPPSNQAPASPEFFGGGDDFQILDQDPWMAGGDEIPGADMPANSIPPIIHVIDEDDPPTPSQPSQPDSNVSDIELDLPPQKQRWLRKMYPKSMMKDLAGQSKSKKAKSKQRAVYVESDNDEPLLPGQSRVQKAANPKDVREIKGDSESESDTEIEANLTPTASSQTGRYPDNEGDSDSDVVEILEAYRPRTQVAKKDEHIEEIFSSEDEIDDDDIQQIFFPDKQATVTGRKHASPLRDVCLIDYMLTRPRNIGGTRKMRATPVQRSERHPTRIYSSSSSKYKFDVTTRDARGFGGVQSLLSFDEPEVPTKRKRQPERGFTPKEPGPSKVASSRPHPGRSGRKHASSSRHKSAIGSHRLLDDNAHGTGGYAHHNDVIGVQDHSRSRPQNWKEKKKARRERAQKNGVWSNNTSGQIITSGANRNPYTTAVEEDEVYLERNFHLALAPDSFTQAQREHWSKQFEPPKSPPRSIRKVPREHTPDSDDGNDTETPEVVKKRLTGAYAVDMHIRSLHAGKSFGATTDIGKGWLYELVNLASTGQEPVQPMTMHFCGYSVDPAVTPDAFCEMLPQITDSFFEFVTALPDLDQEAIKGQWTTMAHAVCQHISWHLQKAEVAEAVLLRQVVENQIIQIVDRINQLALSFVDTPVMAFGWFAVEMAVRISLAEPIPPNQEAISRPLKSSATTLMNLLLQSDVRETMKPFKDTSNLDRPQTSHYAAELWVCLIHAISIFLPKENAPRNKSHPFWVILLEMLRSRAQKQENLLPAESSEITWLTIFSLCSLSQFSTHGMISGQPRLPACWDAAVFALKRIRLTAAPEERHTEATIQRDKYVAIVVKRCSLLHERWKWDLHDASPMFNALSDIFKSRKFANLWGEGSDFADFFKYANWNLLSSYDPKDTAYIVFLKLIVQAAHEDPVYIQRKTSPKVRKWLSLAVPLGSVNLPTNMAAENPQYYLSMLYNRLSAVAVAVDLDIGEYHDRTLKARTYINFASADRTTRLAVLRGMTYWSVTLVARKVKLNGIVDWIQEIATVLETDIKRCHTSNDTSLAAKSADPKQNEWEEKQRQTAEGYALLFANYLLSEVRRIIDAHAKATLYPEPSLITAIKPVLMSWVKKDSRMRAQIGDLAKAIFAARSLVLPPPSRPPPLAVHDKDESQESQDFGMDDFGDLDWDNIDLPEALGPQVNDSVASDIVSKDAALLQALNSVHFKWIIGPFLKPFLQPPPPGTSRKSHEADCDDWIRYFLCCSSLESQADKWVSCLRLLDMMIEDKSDECWTGRVRLSIMFQLLKLDPMAYLVAENRAMEAFMWALVSDHVALEKEYVALFLSIAGLRHPLLHGATLPARDETTGDFSFSSEEFMEARFLFIETIFKNLNELVHKQVTGRQELILENTRHIEALKTMLSSMRNRLNSLKDSQKYASYRALCLRVFALYQECPELLGHEHLRFWLNWKTILTNNS